MIYNTLADSLFQTADLARQHFSRDFGLRGIKIETEILREFNYRPTFFAQSTSYHLICVDVAESNVFTSTRKDFISECEKLSLPVKFYVVLPTDGTPRSTFKDKELTDARRLGTGVILINSINGQAVLLNQALCLSLTGLRMFNKAAFPSKYREHIKNAEEVFKSGDPNKACSIIYDEIEGLTRRIALKSHALLMWNQPLTNPNVLKTTSWSSVVDSIQSPVNRRVTLSSLTDALLAKTKGITTFRNDSGHSPSSRIALITRDTQLRTRMEFAVDLLLELINATKNLKI